MSGKKQLLRAKRHNLVDVIEGYANAYKIERNTYVSKIKRYKKETWQHFEEVNPWGIV